MWPAAHQVACTAAHLSYKGDTGAAGGAARATAAAQSSSSEENEPLAVEPAAGGDSAEEQVGAEGDEWGAMELPPPTAPEPAHPPFDAPGTPSVSFRNAPGHVDLIALQRSSANALKAFWAHPGTFSCPGTYVYGQCRLLNLCASVTRPAALLPVQTFAGAYS